MHWKLPFYSIYGVKASFSSNRLNKVWQDTLEIASVCVEFISAAVCNESESSKERAGRSHRKQGAIWRLCKCVKQNGCLPIPVSLSKARLMVKVAPGHGDVEQNNRTEPSTLNEIKTSDWMIR